jgi:hypothetical protein
MRLQQSASECLEVRSGETNEKKVRLPRSGTTCTRKPGMCSMPTRAHAATVSTAEWRPSPRSPARSVRRLMSWRSADAGVQVRGRSPQATRGSCPRRCRRSVYPDERTAAAGRPSPSQATRRRKSCGDRRWQMRLRVETGGFIAGAEDNVLRYFDPWTNQVPLMKVAQKFVSIL